MAEKTELLEEDEKVVEIELERLRGFENHPFKVRADSQMIELQESIKKYGILNPLIVRPKKDGCYEIISGHRRKFAAEKIGYRKVPVIIRVLKDDEAVVLMVDSNLQREMISPSEKAFAYKMKYEAIKRKAGRRKCGQVDHNLGKKSIELIGEECGDSPKQVQRYIKITELIPEMLEKVDDGSMGFTPAVQLSFLKKKEQKEMLDAMEFAQCTPSLSQALRIKKLSADGKLTVTSGNIQSEAEADELRKLCDGEEAMVTKVKKAQKRISPPKLYDLTSLQRESNRYFGYTAQKTLDMLQELYEEKMVTYPRTDSQYVTEDMKETVETLADEMTDFLPFLKSEQSGGNAERVINNTKVSDHHAILLTKEAVEKGMGGLSDGKKNLMMLIGQQLVQATGEDYLYEQTEISVQCKEHEFATKGKLPVQMGFKEVEEAFRKYCVKDKKSDEPDNKTGLPEVYEEGMILVSVKAEKSTHYTSPPKMFTEDTLLAAMETAGNKEFDSETEKKGLGTPATRANIIEKLVSSGYAERKGKQILPTAAGCELIHVMPENLKSASLTAEWENQLLMMEKGKIRDDEFMDGIVSMITEILSVCRAIPEEERSRFQTAREVIGKCPICGSDVYEGKSNYYCSDRSCPFALWKSNRFLESMKKSMDKKMAVELLKRGRTHVKGLYSKKKDSKFDADLVLGVEDGKARFSLEFPKKKK